MIAGAHLAEELEDWLFFDEFAGLVQMIHYHGLGIDPKGVINCGQQLAGMNGIFHGGGAGLVGFSMDVSLLDPCSGDHAGVAIGPMITAIGTIAIARSADALLRTTTELTDCDDEGFVEQSAIIKIRDESGEALVEHGATLVLDALGEILVSVP